jgi:hypothetical protein
MCENRLFGKRYFDMRAREHLCLTECHLSANPKTIMNNNTVILNFCALHCKEGFEEGQSLQFLEEHQSLLSPLHHLVLHQSHL